MIVHMCSEDTVMYTDVMSRSGTYALKFTDVVQNTGEEEKPFLVCCLINIYYNREAPSILINIAYPKCVMHLHYIDHLLVLSI